MRREGRVRGKPTSKSRLTGRCRSGKTRCRSCRDHPVEKSRAKRLGRHKRFAADVLLNPSLAEFRLQPSLSGQPGSPRARELDEVDTVRVGIFVATVNSVIEAALEDACTTVSIHGSDDHVDTPFGDEAFHRELGMFEKAVEGSERLQCEFGVSSEDESWSDVELSDDDDDWSMVDDHDM